MPVSELVAMMALPGFMCGAAPFEALAAGEHLDQPVDGLLHDFVAGFRFAEIAGQQQARPAAVLYFLLGFLRVGLLFGKVVDRDVGAFTREHHGHGAADSGISARNERDLVFQLVRGLVGFRLVARLRIELRFQARAVLVLHGEGRIRLLELSLLVAVFVRGTGRFARHGVSPLASVPIVVLSPCKNEATQTN